MQIVIDIPEEDYKTIIQRPKQCVVHWDIVDALRNGTPLDDIKAEIQENINYNKRMNHLGILAGLLLALDIIDYKVGKESEE